MKFTSDWKTITSNFSNEKIWNARLEQLKLTSDDDFEIYLRELSKKIRHLKILGF